MPQFERPGGEVRPCLTPAQARRRSAAGSPRNDAPMELEPRPTGAAAGDVAAATGCRSVSAENFQPGRLGGVERRLRVGTERDGDQKLIALPVGRHGGRGAFEPLRRRLLILKDAE